VELISSGGSGLSGERKIETAEFHSELYAAKAEAGAGC